MNKDHENIRNAVPKFGEAHKHRERQRNRNNAMAYHSVLHIIPYCTKDSHRQPKRNVIQNILYLTIFRSSPNNLLKAAEETVF